MISIIFEKGSFPVKISVSNIFTKSSINFSFDSFDTINPTLFVFSFWIIVKPKIIATTIKIIVAKNNKVKKSLLEILSKNIDIYYTPLSNVTLPLKMSLQNKYHPNALFLKYMIYNNINLQLFQSAFNQNTSYYFRMQN